MKSIFSGALIATAVVACLSLNVQAKPITHLNTVAFSDTGKMKSKMSKKKMDKMKMKKQIKDTTKKM
jgi:hypothetical protein